MDKCVLLIKFLLWWHWLGQRRPLSTTTWAEAQNRPAMRHRSPRGSSDPDVGRQVPTIIVMSIGGGLVVGISQLDAPLSSGWAPASGRITIFTTTSNNPCG
jgi:hypothetical protein